MKRVTMSLGIGVALLTLPVGGLSGQERQVTFGGQVRPRMETRASGAGTRATFTSMRVRAQMEASLGNGVQAFIQLQDVRLFGEEGNTLGDFQADALDLHQGYLEMGLVKEIGGKLRVGRQVMALGEQRLVGAVEWTQQGRSFDGARFTASALGPLNLDLFAMVLQEKSSTTWDFDGDLLGAYGTLDLEGGGALDLFALVTRDSRDEGNDQQTFGGLWKGKAGPVDLRFEGSLQRGMLGGADVSAYMLGARAGMALHDKATITLWYDHLSGDEDPDDGEVKVFNTLFATNHAFYGSADYFTDIPLHTGGLGLRDAAVKLALGPWDGTSFQGDLHAFSAAEEGNLSTRSLARELDLTLTHRLAQGLTAVAGYSFVQARDGMKELGRLAENASWAFLMLNAAF